jgi:hypothetical protein
VRIHLATVGAESHHHDGLQRFLSLARKDDVREHHPEKDPDRADAILFVDLQQHPDDPFLRGLRRHALVREHASKVFVYDERDLPFFTFPGAYVSATAHSARELPVLGTVYPNLPNAGPPPSQEPDLLFSFVGSRTHVLRERLLTLEHPRGCLQDTTSGAGTSYTETIARSKFILCPRGHGPSSFRLFETLAAGRVPVILSDDWLPPPRVDWSSCAMRVPEARVAEIPALLERREAEWPFMAEAARRTFSEHFAENRLWHHYASTIAMLQSAGRGPSKPWWFQGSVARVGLRRVRARGKRA